MNSLEKEKLRAELSALKGIWHSPIDIGHGVFTKDGPAIKRRFARRLKHLQLPDDLTGKRALDVGTWDGFFSFELERRGANVLAIDVWGGTALDNFLFAREKVKSSIDYKRLDVHDLDPDLVGKFDIVFCAGLLYHCRYPLIALERLRSVTDGCLILETSALITFVNESFPMIGFFPGDKEASELGKPWGICAAATVTWLKAALYAAGFARVEVKYMSGMRWWHKFMALITNKPRGGRIVLHAFTNK